MDDSRFDQMTSELSQRFERRRLALGAGASLAGLFATGLPTSIEAGKKSKKKKRKKRKKMKKAMCTSAYGQKLRCKPDQCCDPGTSTIAACTEIGFPTCCASSGLAHPLGSTCCTSYYHGNEGVCTNDYPVCCSGNTGGGCCLPNTGCCNVADFGGELFCCPVDRPTCCPQECCPAGDTCDGDFCSSSPRNRNSTEKHSAPVAGEEPGASSSVAGRAFAQPAE